MSMLPLNKNPYNNIIRIITLNTHYINFYIYNTYNTYNNYTYYTCNTSIRPMRQRAMAQLRPVSIPEIVRDMAGSDPVARIQDFDRHYMPDGQPANSAITPFCQFCLTNLLGFCLNITHIALKALIFRNCPQTEVTLMCTEHFLMIRYKPTVILCALPSPVHCCA